MYHIDAGLDSLGRDNEVTTGEILEGGLSGTGF